MNKETNSIQKTVSLIFAGLLLVVFTGSIVLPSQHGQTASAMKVVQVEDTATPTATLENTATPSPTPTGTRVSSRYIVLDYLTVNYPNGTSGLTVTTQNNRCEPTVQGGLHCVFSGTGINTNASGSTRLRSVQPVARFHWSDNAHAKNTYRYQVATIAHTNVFHYNNLTPLTFFPSSLPDGYHEWSGVGNYGNCNPSVCDLNAVFYLKPGYGTYTWHVDTYVAPVAINIYAPTVTPTFTPTRTATLTLTPISTATSTPTNSYTYDRAAAVAYADQWAHEPRNENYPLSNETGCNCNDCTNYISQVLHNGGYPLRAGTWNESNIQEWWYRDVLIPPDYSKTWSATDWFAGYLIQYPAEFEIGASSSSFSPLESGDFILMDLRNNITLELIPDGQPDHARVVIGYGNTSTDQSDYTNGCNENKPIPASTYTLLVNQHCTDRRHVAWDYGIDFGLHNLWYVHVVD